MAPITGCFEKRMKRSKLSICPVLAITSLVLGPHRAHAACGDRQKIEAFHGPAKSEGTLEPTALTPIHFTPVPVCVLTADIDIIDPANDLCANIVDDFAALLVG